MDGILSKLLSFPPHPPPPNPLSDYQYDESIREQIESVGALPKIELLEKTPGGEHVLDVINPAINTVPYTFILLANISACSNGTEGISIDCIWEKIIGYLAQFDPRQVRYIGFEFAAIIDAAANFAQSTNRPELAIIPIREALIRLDPTGVVLTSNHLRIAKMALESQHYDALGVFLDNIILFVPDSNKRPKPKHLCTTSLCPVAYITSTSGLTTNLEYIDVLEYFIYCGIACVGLKKWRSAINHFECAITYPAKDVVSKPMIEAYKKWILCGLITTGKLLILPKSTSGVASRTFHSLAKSYENLALTFEKETASRLKSEADRGEALWKGDYNLGLVHEVLASYQKFQIKNLANIYSRISVPEIHTQTTSAEIGSENFSIIHTEKLIVSMINKGEIHGKITTATQGYSVLVFSSTGPVFSELQMQQELAAAKSRILYISQEIKMTDLYLTHDKEYIKYLQKKKKVGKLNNLDNEDQSVETVFAWNDIVEDEDIMGVF